MSGEAADDARPEDGGNHPSPVVPDPLFDDEARERRWRARYSAPRTSLPVPARDQPQRALYSSNETGTFELYCWDLDSDRRWQVTDRPEGTVSGTLSANGMGVWWFDDEAGDEFGRWMAQPFGSAPGSAGVAVPDIAPGHPCGLEVGVDVVLVGFSDDDGSRVHLVRAGSAPATVYQDDCDAAVGALSRDESLWVLEHTERGDSRYPALRALAVSDNSVLAELDDGPGRGLTALDFSPVPGDPRLLVAHERRGRDELLIWDVADGSVTELPIDLPGDLTGGFTHDASGVLVLSSHEGRTGLYRLDLETRALLAVPLDLASVDGFVARDDGSVWVNGSSAATPPSSVHLRFRAGTEPAPDTTAIPVVAEPLATSTGPTAPGSQPLHDLFVDGPGGRIHALVAVPADSPPPSFDGFTNVPRRAVFLVHGGPDAADDDSFDAERALWLDAGFTTVQVNYRGSAGYGAQWRDALTARVGHTELADIAAVQDRLLVQGLLTHDECVIAGASWGGYLTLLALGTQPSRWAAGIAGVPVADYPVAYDDELESLRAFDRALFGGSPLEVPDKYLDSSPLTWISAVSAPVLILAGRNDPRCPWRQIQNYLAALSVQGKEHALYTYDAGHSSMVVDERIRQKAMEVRFALDALS